MFIKQTIFIVILGLISVNVSYAQRVTRAYLDSIINLSNTNYKYKTDFFFVINGIAYDTNQIDTVISKFDRRYLADALFLSREKQSYPFYREVVLVTFATQQKDKIKRKRWNEAKKLVCNINETNFQLQVDKRIIDANKSKDFFNAIKLKDIMYLDIKEDGDRKEVRIWRTE